LPYARIIQALDRIDEERIARDKAEWVRTAFLSYRADPPCRQDGKTVIPWDEWRDSILGEKPIDDGFQDGDGIKNAERILKKFAKRDIRPATKEEIEKIKKRDAKRRENK